MNDTKIGITFGAFDLLHPGHVIFIKECQKLCDELIIGLHIDPSIENSQKNKPVETVFERYVRLSGLLRIKTDNIIPYETSRDIFNILSSYEINRRFLGSEYYNNEQNIVGYDLCVLKNVGIFYINRFYDWSSSQLRQSIVEKSK